MFLEAGGGRAENLFFPNMQTACVETKQTYNGLLSQQMKPYSNSFSTSVEQKASLSTIWAEKLKTQIRVLSKKPRSYI